MRAHWAPGETHGLTQLDEFGEQADDYKKQRDRPDIDGTSRLSPYLHFGEVSVRQVWHAIRQVELQRRSGEGSAAFLRQLYWREFSTYLLLNFPSLPEQPLRPEFEKFPWRDSAANLQAWQRGETGYPIVDAGMRQLSETGWMHNRVRMIAASFLVKDLLVPWQTGAAWFLDTLVDADLANNSASWQWVAGCGTDAAPYFRVFQPKPCRATSSIRMAAMFANGFRSSAMAARAVTRNRSSITARRGNAPSKPTRRYALHSYIQLHSVTTLTPLLCWNPRESFLPPRSHAHP